jgi:elongation factor 1-beta
VKAAGNLPERTNASAVALKAHREEEDMTKLVARIRILPADAESNPDVVAQSIKKSIPTGMELRAHAKEPIAFGLEAIVGDFLLEDAEGQMDKLEESIKSVEGVGEIEVVNVSRQSVKMK